MATESSVARMLAHLRATIAHHEHLYRQQLEPEISDSEFDALKEQLRALEAEHPHLAQPEQIGSDLQHSGVATPHWRPMLSLKATTDRAELHAFTDPLFLTPEQTLAEGDYSRVFRFSVEHKFDGMAVALHYVNGTLSRALTRGDGQEGETITAQIKCAKGVPHRLDKEPDGAEVTAGPLVEVRGELVILRADFEAYNAEALARGARTYSNPRAMAAAAMRTQDLTKVKEMHPTLIVYDVDGLDADRRVSQADILVWARQAGFTPGWALFADSPKGVDDIIDEIARDRAHFTYDIDGAVIKLADLADREALGATNNHPRWAMAFKLPALEAFSDVVGVVNQIGRTGVATPVLKVNPVPLGGTMVKSITLHNTLMLERFHVRVGDRAVIRRAHDVVPQLVKIIRRNPPVGELLSPPDVCPACATPLVDDGTSRKRCPNALNCSAQAVALLTHFAGPLALDIEGFSIGRVRKLHGAGLLKTPADFYRLTVTNLMQALGVGSVHATALTTAIGVSRFTTLPRLLTGLSILGVSTATAQTIARHFQFDLPAIVHAKADELAEVPGVGEVRSRSMERFFAVNYEAIMDLINQGISWPTQGVMPVESPRPLDGLKLVVTGRIANRGQGIGRDHVWDLYRHHGATLVQSVSRNVTHVIAGERPSPEKLATAKEFGIPILDHETFARQFQLPPFLTELN